MKTGRNAVLLAAMLPFLFAAGAASAADGVTLKTVKERGELLCGVHPSRFGFNAPDSKGRWSGLDADFCRAVAAATLGDADKVRFVALSSQQRFPAIQSGEVDILSRNTTSTLTRDTSLGLEFGPPTFYTGTGFMVYKRTGATKVEDLDGATLCVAPGSTTEKNVSSVFKALNIQYNPVVIENNKQLVKAYLAGRCDVLARDKAGLPGVRRFDASNPDDHVILDGVYSKEPLAMVVRQDDSQWIDIIRWVTYATFNAEEMGVSQANVDEMKGSGDPRIQQLLGVSGNLGEKLGMDKEWAYRVVKQVGNYKDIYDRYFGPGKPLELPRDLNALWTDGGVLYGHPIK